MVADTEPLRSAVQDEIDRCLLQDDELLVARRARAFDRRCRGRGIWRRTEKGWAQKRKRAAAWTGSSWTTTRTTRITGKRRTRTRTRTRMTAAREPDQARSSGRHQKAARRYTKAE